METFYATRNSYAFITWREKALSDRFDGLLHGDQIDLLCRVPRQGQVFSENWGLSSGSTLEAQVPPAQVPRQAQVSSVNWGLSSGSTLEAQVPSTASYLDSEAYVLRVLHNLIEDVWDDSSTSLQNQQSSWLVLSPQRPVRELVKILRQTLLSLAQNLARFGMKSPSISLHCLIPEEACERIWSLSCVLLFFFAPYIKSFVY